MLKMSAFIFDALRESFAKAQNTADCFIGQIVPGSVHSRFRIRYVLWFWYRLTETY